MTGAAGRAWALAVAVVVAGCVAGATAQSPFLPEAEAGLSCDEYVQSAAQHRSGFTSSRVERAFAGAGFWLSSSGLSYIATSAQAARCHGLLADKLLYRGGSGGPCLYVYLFPEWLGWVPKGWRRIPCGDGSGAPAAGLVRGARMAGSLWIEYTLAPREVAKVQAVLDRLVSEP